MAHQHSPLHRAACDDRRADLPLHLFECGCGDGRIVGRVAVPPCDLGVGILEIGHIDVDQPVQKSQLLHALVAAAVEHGRHTRAIFGERRGDAGNVVTAGDELDVVRALALEPFHRLDQLLMRDLISLASAEPEILAIDAAQRTPGEKNRAAPAVRSKHRLFPKMKRGATDLHRLADAAISVLSRPINAAGARAKRTFHFCLGLMSLT